MTGEYMTYKEMQQMIHNYNWDDGFEVPMQILADEKCDLALALEIFYLGDGFTYFLTFAHNIGGTAEWFRFISKLCDDIEHGKYQKTEHHFEIPLSQVQRYQFKKNNIADVFWTDV